MLLTQVSAEPAVSLQCKNVCRSMRWFRCKTHMHIFYKKNVKVIFNDTTLFFLARTCRLTRRNCSVLVILTHTAIVCQKFESVTSLSGLKFLYSSGKFLFCERLSNHMCIEVICNMYLRMHINSNKFYTSKVSANSLLLEPGLNHNILTITFNYFIQG